MTVTVFALPLTIVAGRENADDEPATLPCVLRGAPEVAKLLRDHGALSGNEMFALADTLVAADAIEIHNMASLYAALKLCDGSLPAINEARALPPLPIIVDGRDAGVHLRFIVGAAVATSAVDLVADDSVGRWGLPVTRLLGCRVAAVHVLPGVYPDRDPSTGSRLLFKADALADAPAYGATVQ